MARVIEAGGTAIFPTDTVYGIGCDPHRLDAVSRIYAAKGRSSRKPLTLHLATVAEALEYAEESTIATLAARRFLPGAVTIIVRRPAFISERVTSGLPTLGLRVPAHDLCCAILERTGPLAATSANLSGRQAYVGDGRSDELPEATIFVDGGQAELKKESTIIDVSGRRPRLIRQGAVLIDDLERVLGPIERPLSEPTEEAIT